MKTIYANVNIIDNVTDGIVNGAMLIDDDGSIADISADIRINEDNAHIDIIDMNGAYICPPLIDGRVSINNSHSDNVRQKLCKLAAQSGIGAMILLPDGTPILDNVDSMRAVQQFNHNGQSKIFYHGALSQQCSGIKMAEIGLMHNLGVHSFCDGNKAINDVTLMMRLMQYCKSFDVLLMQHPIHPDLEGHMNAGEMADRLGLEPSPCLAEKLILQRDISLLQDIGGRYHASHISTRAAVDIIRDAKRQGLQVTADTAPHYFNLSDDTIGLYKTHYKTTPPLRGYDDIMAIKEGLKDGTIDAIISDHQPLHDDDKRLPFASAKPGIAMMELLLPLSLNLIHDNILTMPQLVEKLTLNPARIFGLPSDLGQIRISQPANLLIFNPDEPYKWQQSPLSPSNMPLDEYPLNGKVIDVWLDGRSVYNIA